MKWPTVQAIEETAGGVRLRVRVQPKASRNALRIEPDGRICVVLTAPPVEGAANKALVAFLAKRLGLPKGAVRLAHGARSRDKVVALDGVSAEAVRQRLEQCGPRRG